MINEMANDEASLMEGRHGGRVGDSWNMYACIMYIYLFIRNIHKNSSTQNIKEHLHTFFSLAFIYYIFSAS